MSYQKISDESMEIISAIVQKAQSEMQQAPVSNPIRCENNPELMLKTLDCLGCNYHGNMLYSLKKQPSALPEYLYHLTTKENYEKMLEDGKVNISSWEGGSNGCHGIYFVDRRNFVNKWQGTTAPDVTGSDMDVAQALLGWTSKGQGNLVALRVPTSKLEQDQLRFRPYVEGMRRAVDSFDPETMEITDKMVTEGYDISKLGEYINNEPVEYIYKNELPISMFEHCNSCDYSAQTPEEMMETGSETIQKLFREN